MAKELNRINTFSDTNRDVNRHFGEQIIIFSAYNEYDAVNGNDLYDIELAEENSNLRQNNFKDLNDNLMVVAQRKGQNEYVEFIEPKVSNRVKFIETIKRGEVNDEANAQPYSQLRFSNFIFIGTFFISIPIC
ncbi:unnamed protein product [Thelazia callipaeda]|uniref:Uncharacterized protein n=1 Tax=Thelazia callipaeda TaxID=103827 RepID=A0A0N5CQZ2_THECL|nr:unnamed protein product [Thelazia callipaeda]